MVVLEGTEGEMELYWHVRLENCAFREHLEHRHVLSVEIFPFLGDPAESESALETICYLDLSLAAQGHDFAVTEVDVVGSQGDQLVDFV